MSVDSVRPVRTVVLDPGHGGDDAGAVAFGVVERDSNLDLVLRVQALLESAGIRVVLTRQDEGRPIDISSSSVISSDAINRADLQARVDRANAAAADVFVSIHSNGAADPELRGVEVWYDSRRPFSERSREFAQLLQDRVLAELSDTGYAVLDRGVRDGRCWRVSQSGGGCVSLFVLEPPHEIPAEDAALFGSDAERRGAASESEVRRTRATQMPAALMELLFITNEAEAALLRQAVARDALARGIANAIVVYLGVNTD